MDLVYFHILAVVNNAAMNMCIQIPLRDPAFSSLSIYPKVELLNHVVILVWGNGHTVFHNSYIIVYFQQQCSVVPISPHPHQYLIDSFLVIVASLMGVR